MHLILLYCSQNTLASFGHTNLPINNSLVQKTDILNDWVSIKNAYSQNWYVIFWEQQVMPEESTKPSIVYLMADCNSNHEQLPLPCRYHPNQYNSCHITRITPNIVTAVQFTSWLMSCMLLTYSHAVLYNNTIHLQVTETTKTFAIKGKHSGTTSTWSSGANNTCCVPCLKLQLWGKYPYLRVKTQTGL